MFYRIVSPKHNQDWHYLSTAVSLVCPRDILISTEPSRNYSQVFWSSARVLGNADFINVISTHQTGELFYIGLTVVVYRVVSMIDNETVTTCRFGISVLGELIALICFAVGLFLCQTRQHNVTHVYLLDIFLCFRFN